MKQNRMKKVTIKDVSNYCKVSPATVSRVLSNSTYPVNKITKEKILQAARELKYIANGFSYENENKSSSEIAVVIPTISNPFYTSLVSGFEAVVSKSGYNIIIYNSASSASHAHIIDSIISKNVKGVLVASANMDSEFTKIAMEGGFGDTKLVFADCTAPQNNFNSVCFDYKKGTYLATKNLIENGHKNIVYAGMKLDRESRNLRLQGFCDSMTSSGIAYTQDQILMPPDSEDEHSSENYQLEIGERLAEKILEVPPPQRPTAIVAVNDMVAFGILRYLKKHNIAVPQDMSIVGFDDNVFCEACSPPLTTIKVQDEQIGRMAGMLLLDDINGTSPPSNISMFLEPCLVERDTVCKINI